VENTAKILLDLFLIFAAAKVAGEIFNRLKQPVVVGEILAGMLIGPSLLGWIGHSSFLDIFAELGVIFLLFTVGLQTDLTEMVRVGKHALAVAVGGVTLPFILGYALMAALNRPLVESLFVATALVATSVGITARVLADLGKLQTRAARVILGAAVVDDILGMIVLAVVIGISRGKFSLLSTLLVAIEAIAFTAFVVVLGRKAIGTFSHKIPKLHMPQPAFALGLALCLGLSAAASYIGLAAIIGAFLAGLVLAEATEATRLRQNMEPIYEFLVPIFFVITGSRMDLPKLFTPPIISLTLLVVLVAVIGKFLGCGAAAFRLGRHDATAVGVGMIPRGEVGIVVAMVGLSRGVISGDLFSVVISMSILTTLMTPPLLRLLLARRPLVV